MSCYEANQKHCYDKETKQRAKPTKQFMGAIMGMAGALAAPVIIGIVLWAMGIALAAKCPIKASSKGAEIAGAIFAGPLYLIVRAFMPNRGWKCL